MLAWRSLATAPWRQDGCSLLPTGLHASNSLSAGCHVWFQTPPTNRKLVTDSTTLERCGEMVAKIKGRALFCAPRAGQFNLIFPPLFVPS